MKRTQVRGSTHPLALLVAGLVLAVVPASLQAEGQGDRVGTDIAAATVYSGGVDFMPAVAHRGGFITVSGSGVLFRQKVGADERPTLGVFDPEGQVLPDGVYKWELQLTPNAATAKQLRAAAAENGGKAPAAWRSLSGTFAIRNGLIATPDLVEAEPGRDAGASGLPLDLAVSSGPRAAALDDDASVGSHATVEAAAKQPPSVAPTGLMGADRSAPERSDAGALAMGTSLEGALAPTQQLSGPAAERPARNYLIDNAANGRDRSRKQ